MYIKFHNFLMFIYSLLIIIIFIVGIYDLVNSKTDNIIYFFLAIAVLFGLYGDSEKSVREKKYKIKLEQEKEELKKERLREEAEELKRNQEKQFAREKKIMDGVVFYTLVRYEVYNFDELHPDWYGYCILDFNNEVEELEVKTFKNYILVNGEVYVKRKYDNNRDTYYYINDTEDIKYEFYKGNLHETREGYFGEYKETSLITEKDRIHEEDYEIGYFDINKNID